LIHEGKNRKGYTKNIKLKIFVTCGSSDTSIMSVQAFMVEALRKLASRRVEGLDLLCDEEIVEMCKKELPHDVTAFREILRRYEGVVHSTCMRMLGTQADAEEITQDALLQVFHKIHQFEGRSKFKTWLYTIVQNYCRNRLTKIIRKREGTAKYEEYAKQNEYSHENADLGADLSESVQEAINKLKEKEKEVLVMKFISGLTIQEMADVLGVGLSAAKMRLYRAMESFKEVYQTSSSESV